MNRVHKETELLLHLFLTGRLADNLPSLCKAQLEKLLDLLHLLYAFPLGHVWSWLHILRL